MAYSVQLLPSLNTVTKLLMLECLSYQYGSVIIRIQYQCVSCDSAKTESIQVSTHSNTNTSASNRCALCAVYATTASNPDESSYACYWDQKRQTYLGDVYSVNWMEDSDAVSRMRTAHYYPVNTLNPHTLPANLLHRILISGFWFPFGCLSSLRPPPECTSFIC